jgi:hypothetical protein
MSEMPFLLPDLDTLDPITIVAACKLADLMGATRQTPDSKAAAAGR